MSLFTSRKKAAENVAGPAEPLVRTPTQQAWIRFRKIGRASCRERV